MQWFIAYAVIGVLVAEAGYKHGFVGNGSRAMIYLCVVLFWLPALAVMALFGCNNGDSK